MWLALWLGCVDPPLEPCDCPVPGHGVRIADQCSCLPHLPPTPLPDQPTEFLLEGGEALDWARYDDALATGDVLLRFTPGDRWPRLYIERTDVGPHRLVLDGGAGRERAIVEGILTPYDEGPRHRVTIRGFEITGSSDKGIFWEAGDEVLIEDVILHGNRGSPALNLEYSNRSGYPSEGFTVRNTHIYDQGGECLYIGGAEGTGQPSHTGVRVENNLIHDCRDPLDSHDDAINIKDVDDVLLTRNIVAQADWGIEVAAPGLYSHNLVLDTRREGFMISDLFQPLQDMVFTDNLVLRPGHDGMYLSTSRSRGRALRIERSTILDAGQAGIKVSAEAGVELDIQGIVVARSAVGFDGYGDAAEQSELVVQGCRSAGNGRDFDRLFAGLAACTPTSAPTIDRPAGPDGLFFTDDDPWVLPGGAQLPP